MQVLSYDTDKLLKYYICNTEAQPNQAMSSREERLKARKVIRMKNKQHKYEIKLVLEIKTKLTLGYYYRCSECNRIFKTTKDLNRHLYVHTEEKPYRYKNKFLFIKVN